MALVLITYDPVLALPKEMTNFLPCEPGFSFFIYIMPELRVQTALPL